MIVRDLDEQIAAARQAYVDALAGEVEAARVRMRRRDALFELLLDRFLAARRAATADGRRLDPIELLRLGVPCRDCARVVDAGDGRHTLQLGGRAGWYMRCGRTGRQP